MLKSTRIEPEERVVLGNGSLRLDFDPRTSDTMYNYIWVKRPDTGEWERPHNFGIDVRGFDADGGELINCIGMNLGVERDGNSLRVTYPDPLIRYRQFDDKIGSPELVARYPDNAVDEMPQLEHADGSLEFTYAIDPERPSFTIAGRVLSGRIENVVYIISALWTDNRALPTYGYYEGFPEYDIRTPEAQYHRDVEVEDVAYCILYRHDGRGVPLALMPLEPVRAGMCNYFDNWKCLEDFGSASVNQQYVPEAPAVTGSNDGGYTRVPEADGRLGGLRAAFFPEHGWDRGGRGHALRDRIERTIIDQYMDGNVRDYWDRTDSVRYGKLTLRKAPWE